MQTPLVSSFVTGDMGMGHVIVSAEDAEATLDFYIDVLGFVERNTMGRTWFLGCNPRHHTFGIARRRGPGALLHLMVEAATLDDVGLAIDRAAKLGVPMMNTLGKHTNDQMVSFYVYSPENYAIEFGWNGLLVTEEHPTYEITQGAFWGHKFTPPPAAIERRMSDAIERAAQRLIDAAATGIPCDPILDLLPDGTVDDAYDVQQRVIAMTRRWRCGEARRVGRKIGLTSPVVQQMFGVDRPDFGVLFADMAIGDGEPVPRTRLMQPRVEAEVAFVLKRDLPDRPVIASDVMRATDFVVAAIEIVDSRIKDWNISIVDTVADNASSGMFVLGGAPKRLRRHRRPADLRDGDDRRRRRRRQLRASARRASARRSTPSCGWRTRSPSAARHCRPAR